MTGGDQGLRSAQVIRTGPSSAGRWSIWFGRDAIPTTWPVSTSPRRSRSATGWQAPAAGRASGRRRRRRLLRWTSWSACAGRCASSARSATSSQKRRPGSRAGDRPSAVRVFGFMSAHQARFPVTAMARVLGVSTAGDSCLAQAATVGACQGRCCPAATGSHGSCDLAGDLRDAPRPCRASGRRREARPQADRQADARGRLGGHQPPRGPGDDAPRPRGATGSRPDRPGLLGRCAEPAVGGRHHLHPDLGWVSVPGASPSGSDRWRLDGSILDAWSRKVVGWSMANHLRTELVLDALDAAVARAAGRVT